jgi:hypothetical protein
MEPLSDLATRPSYLQTWPFSLSLKAARKLVTYLPSATQANLPPFLLPAAEHHETTLDEVAPAPAIKNGKKGKKSRDNTPRDSPAATEGESEDGEEIAEENGEANASKKKKKGLGKAGGARRRKMAMK